MGLAAAFDHLGGHVHSDDFATFADLPGGKEAIDSAAAAQDGAAHKRTRLEPKKNSSGWHGPGPAV